MTALLCTALIFIAYFEPISCFRSRKKAGDDGGERRKKKRRRKEPQKKGRSRARIEADDDEVSQPLEETKRGKRVFKSKAFVSSSESSDEETPEV